MLRQLSVFALCHDFTNDTKYTLAPDCLHDLYTVLFVYTRFTRFYSRAAFFAVLCFFF